MAIIIPQNMLFGTPNIELITDNKVNQIDYNNNIINGKYNNITKSIYSKSIIAWSIPKDEESYFFGVADNGEDVNLRSVTYPNENLTRYFAEVDLKNIKSDFYFSSTTPYDKAYFKFDINYYMNDQNSTISSEAELSKESLIWYSSSTNVPLTVYTKQEQPSDVELYSKGQFFNPIWQFNNYNDINNMYYDYINSKLYIYLGRKNNDGNLIFVTTSLSIELFYPTFELTNNKQVINNIENNEYNTNNYTMETNSFMNSYIDINNNEINFVDNQAQEIMFNYENGRLRANITCNYGKYMNDDGTLAYSGNDGKTIKVGDIVQLNLSKVNKQFEVLKSEIIYSGNIRINLLLEEIDKVFGINEKLDSSVIVTYNRIYSKLGSIGEITSKDKLYENDIIQLTISLKNNNAYNLESIIVNGQSISNGNTITITKDLNVYVTTSVKTFTITPSISDGVSLVLTRQSSPYGKGILGAISPNDTFYYGDVLNIFWDLDSGYTIDDAYFNDEKLYKNIPNKVNITKNSTINIVASLPSWKNIWNGNMEINFGEFDETIKYEEFFTLNDLDHPTRITIYDTIYISEENGNVWDSFHPSYDMDSTNDTYSLPITFSSQSDMYDSRPYVTISVENLHTLKFQRNIGSMNGNKYAISKVIITKIEQYY